MSAGRRWAYIGAALGAVVSIAANVAHSFVPPAGVSTAWTPQAGAVVGAVFWPVALFVAVEILARVAWPAGRRWFLLRFGGLLPVAMVAAVVSYRHLSGLLDFYGEDPLTVAVGPLAVDGLMVVASAALVATSRVRQAEVPAVPLPPIDPVPVLVEPDPAPPVLPTTIAEAPGALATTEGTAKSVPPVRISEPKKSSSSRTVSAPKRTFEQTRRAAAALDADGMAPADIATTLGITPRQVRTALKPVPVDGGSHG